MCIRDSINFLWNYFSFHVYHCFMNFSFFLHISLLYGIFNLFIFIIALYNSIAFIIDNCFIQFFFFSCLPLFNRTLFLIILIIVLWYYLNINECPLSFAIKANSIEIAKFLVEHGADVNMKLILFLFIYIFILWFYLSFHIYHCFV